MRALLVSTLLLSACFELDLSGFEPCTTRDECADEQVCELGYCVLPNDDVERCGDGKLQDGEQCDDRNRDDTDGCRNNCQTAICGDGVARTDTDDNNAAFEVCDDGDELPTGTCSSNCKLNCISMWFDGEKSVGVNEGMVGTSLGVIAGAPRTFEFWLRPDFPASEPFDWTLLAKQRVDTGENLRFDIKRAQANGPIAGVLLIEDVPKATISLPESGWFHLAFTLEAAGNNMVITPYANGLPGDAFTLRDFSFSEPDSQTGDAFLGQRPGQLEAREHRYRGAIAAMNIHNSVVHRNAFSPPNPFQWYHAVSTVSWHSRALGREHEPSGGRVYWGPLAAFFPFWLDDGFETIAEAPWCVIGWQCGDGTKTEFEGCDDGNRDDGDGCSAACQSEG
jgi:cysteine-rich repeat protein